MGDFLLLLDEELAHQKELLRKGTRAWEKGAEGLLRCRDRKHGKVFYQYGIGHGEFVEKNITEENIHYLEKLKCHYRCSEPDYILKHLPNAYREASKAIGFRNARRHGIAQTRQYHYNPEVHIHETLSGSQWKIL